MLIINGLAFFILLRSYQIWNVVLLIKDYTGVLIISEKALYWLGWVSRLCPPINFSINPLIYGGSSKYYREAFWEVFQCHVESCKYYWKLLSKVFRCELYRRRQQCNVTGIGFCENDRVNRHGQNPVFGPAKGGLWLGGMPRVWPQVDSPVTISII